jgi:DNA polymerase II large subunit
MQIRTQTIVNLYDTAKCEKCNKYFVVDDDAPMFGKCDVCKNPKAIVAEQSPVEVAQPS